MRTSLVLFHTFNGGINIFGLTILVYGIKSGLSENVFGTDGADEVMRQVDFFIAVLGLTLMLMSCLGYVGIGTVRKTEVTECRGLIYISVLSILFLALISAGSFEFYYSYKFTYDQQLIMFDNMLFYWNTRIPGILQRVAFVDKIQRALECCGFHDKYIFPDIPKHGLPKSCCPSKSMLTKDGACPEEYAYENGCIEKDTSIRTLENANFALGIVAILTACFVLSAVVFNFRWKRVIWRSLKKNKGEAEETFSFIGSDEHEI